MRRYVGRLAPSPTGALHLGNVRTFMIAWLRARSQGGKVILRMEDLDHPKDKPGADIQAIEDLKWLGFDWNEEYVQSTRKDLYRDALETLRARGLVYPCVCSRRDVEAAQSAPHAGEQLYYPGTCRNRFKTWEEAVKYRTKDVRQKTKDGNQQIEKSKSSPCWRFKVPEGTIVSFDDVFCGHYEQDVSRTLGDFPLARDEFGAGYTLACAVDDLLMGVTEVVRGDDLLAATPTQILVANALANKANDVRQKTKNSNQQIKPNYCHIPLVVGPDGRRLAKRHGDTRVATYRAQGTRPEEIIGFLAASCGWVSPHEQISLADLVPQFNIATIPQTPFMI